MNAYRLSSVCSPPVSLEFLRQMAPLTFQDANRRDIGTPLLKLTLKQPLRPIPHGCNLYHLIVLACVDGLYFAGVP